jgi:hypothetical protein
MGVVGFAHCGYIETQRRAVFAKRQVHFVNRSKRIAPLVVADGLIPDGEVVILLFAASRRHQMEPNLLALAGFPETIEQPAWH